MDQPGERAPDAVRASADARERSRRLCDQAADAVARAEALARASHQLLAAAGRSAGGEPPWVAHAIYDVGPATATKGVTLCSLLATDEVELIPELPWAAVQAAYRCLECERVSLGV